MRVINLKQNTDGWLEFRRTHIGSSDASIIMNTSPFCSPYMLWRRKLGLEPEQEVNSAMQRGIELEPIAREYLEKEWGHNFIPIVGQSEEYPYMIASFDAWSPDLNCYVEIKCPGKKDHQATLEGNIPPKYLPQLLHQMLVSNSEKITYMSFDGQEAVYIDFYLSNFKNHVINDHLKKMKEFYDYMINLDPPPLTNRDYVQKDDLEWHEAVKCYKNAEKECKDWEKIKESYRKKLIELAGNQSSMGAGIKVSKVVHKGRVDYNTIPELIGINLDGYRMKPTETWRIYNDEL